MRTFFSLLAAVALFFGVAACSDDTSRDDARSDLVDQGLTEAQADCVLDLADELDIDYDADQEDVSEEKRDEFISGVSDCQTAGS